MKLKKIVNIAINSLKLVGFTGYFYFIAMISLLILSPDRQALANSFTQNQLIILLMGIGFISGVFIVTFALDKLISYVKSTWEEKCWVSYGKLSIQFLPITLFILLPFYLIKNGMYLSQHSSPAVYLFSLCLLMFIACNRLTTFIRFIKAKGY